MVVQHKMKSALLKIWAKMNHESIFFDSLLFLLRCVTFYHRKSPVFTICLVLFAFASKCQQIKVLKNNCSLAAVSLVLDTVDGRSPAPVDMASIPLFTCIHPKWCRIPGINTKISLHSSLGIIVICPDYH